MLRRLALIVTALAIVCTARNAAAQDEVSEKGTFGLGVIIGEPTGLSAKLYLSNDTAIDFAVGASFIGGGLHIHSNFLWHPWVLESRDSFVLPLYLGPGARFLFHNRGDGGDDDFHIGIRATVGILFDFREVPLDVFLEVAPILDFVFGSEDDSRNGVDFIANVAAGVRYYF